MDENSDRNINAGPPADTPPTPRQTRRWRTTLSSGAAGLIVLALIGGGGYALSNPDLLHDPSNPVKQWMADHGLSGIAADNVRNAVAAPSSDAKITPRKKGKLHTSGYALLEPGFVMGGQRVPGRWCPGEIGYSIDFTAALDAGLDKQTELARWRSTFRQWERASGRVYTFRYLGPAQHPISVDRNGLNRRLENISVGSIAITYATASGDSAKYTDPQLARALGHGGIGPVHFDQNTDNPASTGHVSYAGITIDALALPTKGREPTRVYVHEVGHALGLAHVNNPRSVMHVENQGPVHPKRGDRAGLRALTVVGCSS